MSAVAGPGLVCVGGAPGAGKTTVGALVARGRRAALVDLDSATTPLLEAFAAELGEPADLDAPRLAAVRDARYACLAGVVADCLACGVDVVVVAPFTREGADARVWRAWGLALGAGSVTTCWLTGDPAVAAARRAGRGAPRDLAGSGAHAGSAAADLEGVDVVLDASDATAEELAARLAGAWPPR
ncbi:AAA family ATPase [Phycicoccus endophyticus]|uniref:AAA family ATPase n=1 Tax=Phycicoccus endophyticus TaxID=1690220 RepID=UPI00166594AE|nr:AAA family ATPase [Phycicoccus endophyticus]GGL29230.1 hypothetical protein GCM10012283_09410 [Phycicoccus endophyticus]